MTARKQWLDLGRGGGGGDVAATGSSGEEEGGGGFCQLSLIMCDVSMLDH